MRRTMQSLDDRAVATAYNKRLAWKLSYLSARIRSISCESIWAGQLTRGVLSAIISNDKKEKRRIRERVNDSDPQGVAAIKMLRSRVTLAAETESCAAADSEHKNVIFIARGGRALYIYRATADYGRWRG